VSFTVKLTIPITDMGEQKTEITLREPTIGDYRTAIKLHQETGEQLLFLIAQCAGLTDSGLNQVALQDLQTLQDKLTPFLPPFLIAGLIPAHLLATLGQKPIGSLLQ
jgi:hypothetical protein